MVSAAIPALQFDHRTHYVQRVAVAVVGVGDHRQARHPADAGGLLDEFAEGDRGEVRRRQDLQEATEPPRMPHSKPRSAAIRADMGSNTEAVW